jgi:hypothetical protein
MIKEEQKREGSAVTIVKHFIALVFDTESLYIGISIIQYESAPGITTETPSA